MQIMNNILKIKQKVVAMETVIFQIRSSEKYLFGFNHSDYAVKTEFFLKRAVVR